MKPLFLFLLAIISISTHGQTQSPDKEMDSIQVFSFDAFYAMVLQYHPIVQQADLLPQQAAQDLRLARGAFDPKLEGAWDFKDFNETEYFNLLDVSLKVPLWFPIDPKIGFERNTGTYLNQENFISDKTDNQQIYAGVSIPIGKGLFIDKRRATVRQALVMQEMAEAEQVKVINKILLKAVKDYWEWYLAYNNFVLMEQSIVLAQDIFDRAKMGFEYGEVAAMDTVQAKITLLTRITDMQQANIDRAKAALTLSNHLWNADGAPLELAENLRPQNVPLSDFNAMAAEQLVTMARENHPEIQKLRLKNNSLQIERSLAKEMLKPQLDVGYYLLDQPLAPQNETNEVTFQDNYKIGVDFSFPIFLRKERAKLRKNSLKIDANQFKQEYTERKIVNAINAEYVNLINTGTILSQQQSMVDAYENLLDAERLNLQNGESDLFKINIQIEKLIKARSKLFKLRSSYQKSIAQLYWEAGVARLGIEEVK